MSGVLKYTPVRDISSIVATQRAYFKAGKTLPISARLEALHKLARMIDTYYDRILAALKEDMNKPKNEAAIMELDMVKNDVWMHISRLREWTAPQSVEKEGVQKLDSIYTIADPKGVIANLVAFNYPVQIALMPLVGILSAGNTCVLKPSEVSVATAVVLTEAIQSTFAPELVAVVNGAVEETTALLAERFDHIVYTGGSVVAKIIYAAAAKHLTPVTLELGGKSPVYVSEDANIPVAARRLAWGRFINAGNTCIAPDYVLVQPSVKAQLIDEMRKAIKCFYGENPKTSKDYCRIVNTRHFDRIMGMLKKSAHKVVIGGESDANDLYIAPTVVTDVDLKSPLMTEEIFGPILPILDIAGPEEAIAFINERENPLAMYIFSTNKAVQQAFLRRTTAGGVTINDTLMHASCHVPFGGCGNSGIGAYHGHASFLEFSHKKGVLEKAPGLEFVNDVRYPPYTDTNLGLLRMLLVKNGPESNALMYVVGAALTAAVAIYWHYYKKKLF